MAAHYLLAMLVGAEPRGLPGTIIDRVELQRAAEGHPLDDVIVHAHNERGETSILEIQVKRSIAFTLSDEVFKGVIAQIAEAYRKPDFLGQRYHLAVATSRTSRKIDGAYQDVLTWARHLGSASEFMDRIERPGSANDDMRAFVRTFRVHLRDAGIDDGEATTWELLRRLQILVYDFTAQGSAAADLAKERAARALHTDDTSRAGALWSSLTALALEVAASGGSRDRQALTADLTNLSYRLAGEARLTTVRSVLAEASKAALADINDRIGTARLTRYERVGEVHAALDTARYVEIRGDAGVGKSAVLKHFAEQIEAESRAIVLSPGRIIPRGWTAMRGTLGFDGTARQLLSDLASDGAAAIFIDNLDLYTQDEQRTVIDLVREAAFIPGLAVIATARRNFGTDEASWLPEEALARLGRAEPVDLEELSDTEVEELRHAAPHLAPLLADDHPARDVTRNLYRLSRLALHPTGDPVPRTEIDMAERWWRTADGKMDATHRGRARLLQSLGEQALLRAEPLDVADRPAEAVDALIASETLSELRNDRVTFRHDVLREWAIANVLIADTAKLEQLPLAHPAPAILARAVELAARFAIERSAESTNWSALLASFSRPGVHGAWRRAVLLALVRSEIGGELLGRTSALLSAEGGLLLQELIRTVIAVEAQPASRLLEAFGVDPASIPPGLNIPRGPTWQRLIRWLLSLGQSLPPSAVPDVADLYIKWLTGFFGAGPYTRQVLGWLHYWLTAIENGGDSGPGNWRSVFSGFSYEQMKALEDELRTGFLLFCNRTPDLAVQYARAQLSRSPHRALHLLQFRGALPQAAPAELAELTEKLLIPEPSEVEDRHRRRARRDPFEFADHDLMPASPAQGPFFELLIHAPEHGLRLIRRLVDYAISFYSDGQPDPSDGVVILLPTGDRVFPYIGSYRWSRDSLDHCCVTSGLMALEAWGHRRIEGGEAFELVLQDILDAPGAPAAYLLVAVDLLLSHWPQSRDTAMPFLGCPELLCINRERLAQDTLPEFDPFGLSALHPEPKGVVSVNDLKVRPSRRMSLDQLIGLYALSGTPEQRQELAKLFEHAAARLGPPPAGATLADPAFMTVHALNLSDLKNWHQRTVDNEDGSQTKGYEYVSPAAEAEHLKRLRDAAAPISREVNVQASIGIALIDPSRSSPEFAARAVDWAQKNPAPTPTDDRDRDTQWMHDEAVLAAALIVMRDGSDELRAQSRSWADGIFARALQSPEDPAHRFRGGLRFNPIAMAFAGMAYELKDQLTPERLRSLVEIAARDNPAAAHGFGSVATILAAIDERLPQAILRAALSTAVRPWRQWDKPEEEFTAQLARHRADVQAAVERELEWLDGRGPEPEWPSLSEPRLRTRRRRRLVLVGGEQPRLRRQPPPSDFTDHQAAALWLGQTLPLADGVKRPWLREVVRSYSGWTATANGAELDPGEEVAQPPNEWNRAYFSLLACCLQELSVPEIEALALTPICSLPDERFFDVTAEFLRSVDIAFFNRHEPSPETAAAIREQLAHRLMNTAGWSRMIGDHSASIETHIGPAIATLFFNGHGYVQPAKCYLTPVGIERIDPFLPTLKTLMDAGPSFFVAIVALNLFEVSPKPDHLPYVIDAAMAWQRAYPDSVPFWVDTDLGRRVCNLIELTLQNEPGILAAATPLRFKVDDLLPSLVRIGVPEAARLENSLLQSGGA
ncbi:MAG: hypothetical protein ACRD1Y_09475 [Terriglobales bacterium]